MPVTQFDHSAVPTNDIGRMAAFYVRLGFDVPGSADWNDEPPPFCSIQFGENKIHLHGPELWQAEAFTLRGPTAQPGCGDFCFVWDGGLEALLATLERAGVEIEEGPVERLGARAGGTAEGTSVYVRDPDRNLLEFIVYD